MTDFAVIRLAGPPKGKGRPRVGIRNGRAMAYTPEPTRNYEAALRMAGQIAMSGRPPIQGPLSIRVSAFFPIPQSWSRKKRNDAIAGIISPTTKPDIDNIVKCIDALNGVVWVDDVQIVRATVWKRYSETPELLIYVDELVGGGS